MILPLSCILDFGFSILDCGTLGKNQKSKIKNQKYNLFSLG